ncbi:MAG TPA: hypothetical protein VJ992_07785 [Gemmatimonadales bacterium]|nr:hypothetical protein [Gemmatimonadales bacterium]
MSLAGHRRLSPRAGWLALLVVFGAMVCAPSPAAAQCDVPHYRWAQKTEESLASTAARRTNITSILRQWSLLEFTRADVYKCAERVGNERHVYSVLGWVRRVLRDEDDGDWHIEVTVRADTPIDSCMVVEIPPADLSGLYGNARSDLDSLESEHGVTEDASGDLSQPLRVRIVGAAFFDGQHRGGADRRDRTDGSHGRCNSSARALWEIHPVYWVTEP